ncbi:MAG: hypothetical protein MZV64_04785 [Ignavibacteriales bacterium]|nr:hypothetical protein [Ignavibacteriales bacterium]
MRRSSLEDLPEAAAVDRDNLRRLGVKSNLTIPLSVGGERRSARSAFNTTRERARVAGRAGEAVAACRAGLHERPRPKASRTGAAGK